MTKNKIKDIEFKTCRFYFKGFPTKQWVVKVLRTWDDGRGYKGRAWRDIAMFDSEKKCKEWTKNQTLLNQDI
jgi:hypothetical protein